MGWIGPFESGDILVVHAAVVPGGAKVKVLMFGGSEHNGEQGGTDEAPADPAEIDRTALYDVDEGAGSIERISSPSTDVFCSGHAFLGDGRLLVAGLYNESQLARKAGKGEDANRLIQMMRDRNPTDATTQIMWAESLLLDTKNPAAALAALDSVIVRPDDARLRPRRDMLAADALRQAGHVDSARVVLQTLATQFPANVRVKAKLDSLGGAPQ